MQRLLLLPLPVIQQRLHKGVVILIVGTRQSGKKTLAEQLCPPENEGTFWLSGEDISDTGHYGRQASGSTQIIDWRQEISGY
jgi:ABC-type iron transport system FetAB ATPase subunit